VRKAGVGMAAEMGMSAGEETGEVKAVMPDLC